MRRDSSYRLAEILKEISIEAEAGWTGYGTYELSVKIKGDYVVECRLLKAETSINVARS